MTVLTRLLLPVGVGLLAAGLNWYALRSTVASGKFVAVRVPVAAGEPFRSGGDTSNLAPIDLPLDANLGRVALAWSDVKALEGRPAPRSLQSGDLILKRDAEVTPLELQPGPGESALQVSLEGVTIEPELLMVGEQIGFFIAPPELPGETRDTIPEPEYVGPFRLLSVGSRLTRTRDAWAADRRDEARIITVAIRLTNGAPEQKTLRLLQSKTGGYGRGGILSVVTHVDAKNRHEHAFRSEHFAMKIWFNNVIESRRNVVEVNGDRVRIGRKAGNDIVLDSPYVADEAAVLYRRGGNWQLVALGLSGCQVGEKEIRGGDRHDVTGEEVIRIFPFTLTLDLPTETGASPEAIYEEKVAQLMLGLHLDLLSRMDVRGEDASRASDDYLLTLERNIEEVSRLRGLAKSSSKPLVDHIAGQCLRGRLLDRLLASSPRSTAGVWGGDRHWSRMITAIPDREDTLQRTADFIIRQLNVDTAGDLGVQIEKVERGFWSQWRKQVAEMFEEDKLYFALWHLKKQIKDIFFGYGPLEDLLRIPTISEIMVVDSSHIYIEKSGVLENSGRRFISDAVTLSIIERIVSRVGRRIDKSQPLVDARLSDGSRVNAVIPPLTVSGPSLTIRKFPQRNLLIDDLVNRNSLTRTVAEFLRAAVRTRKNLIISGGTGTGKTTLLNCLSDFIPDKERIVTVEDTAELQLKKEHVVRMETKQANLEGKGAYTIRDLVKNSLRMRPDRIIIGECRGGEALDMLQAMNTGHDGSLTTIHANTCEDVILRLEVLVQMAADLPVQSIHRQIASAVDLIVQLTRLRDGRRVVSQVSEVTGIDPATHKVVLKDLFALSDHDDGSRLAATGRLPSFMEDLIRSGLVELDTFYL